MKELAVLFSEHPASVGESYSRHAAFAAGVGLKMVLGGLACLVHAAFPFLFKTTGSACLKDLSVRINRGRTN